MPHIGPHYFRRDWITASDHVLEADVCVYGGTAGGVVAAITAARRGKRAVLLHPGTHLGGMTTGGLGWTDVGNEKVIGGTSREFYQRVGRHYGREIEWKFEPGVAAKALHEMLNETDVEVHRKQFLARDTGVSMDGRRISEIKMLGGLRVRARQFIDATYEGDLMAAAGVSHTVGRESNATYGETLNGIQVRHQHQFSHPVDPYQTPGDPGSGLLPYVEADRGGDIGDADHRIQAYCFRLCMTDDPAIQVPFEPTDDYDEQLYELAARWYHSEKDRYNETLFREGERKGELRKYDRFPVAPHKTDTNNHGPVSTDFIGANHDWPEADYETRERIFQHHVSYQKGLHWFLGNSERMPDEYREAFGAWGLAGDEFTDTGHWPHQLYVREARRMVGDYVVTEQDCMAQRRCDDPVGMGAYQMDSHNCHRFVEDGRVLNGGDVQVKPERPYSVSYRAIVPRRGECENLSVPVCLSASHIAYGSVRMEPVFMMLGQSAATAATMALDNDVALQALPYETLRDELLEAQQVLESSE